MTVPPDLQGLPALLVPPDLPDLPDLLALLALMAQLDQ